MDIKREGKILYICSVDISQSNGPGVNEREFTSELCNVFGERTHILIEKPEIPLELDNAKNFTFVKGHRHYNPIVFLQHQVALFCAAKKLLKTRDFNFIILRLDILPIAIWLITMHYKMPYAIKTFGAGAIDGLSQHGGFLGRILTPINTLIVKSIASRSIAIDVCTKAYLSFFRSRLGLSSGKFCWIENATNTNRFHPINKSTARSACGLSCFDSIVGFVGGRPWERGGVQMIEVIPPLLSKYPGLGIIIVGGGSAELELLRKRAIELGVLDHCVFTGVVPYVRIPYFINAFDVGISFDTKSRLNNIGNSSQKVRQYIACGKPVVSGKGGNLFLEKEKLGTIIDPDDGVQTCKAIFKWLSLSNYEKDAHSRSASEYAKRNLSIRKTLNDRLEFWNTQLGNIMNKSCK